MIETRAKVIAIATIVLVLTVSIGLSSALSTNKLVKVEIYNSTSYESLTILKPGRVNWIKLLGGKRIILPKIRFIYNGVTNVSYKKDGKTIKIISYGIKNHKNYVVNYPFHYYPVYYRDEPVSAEVITSSKLAGDTVYIYLVKTYPTQVRDDISAVFNGKFKPLRDLLNSSIQKKQVVVNSAGVAKVSFGKLLPGDYVIVATLNKTSDKNVTLISTIPLEVLELKSLASLKSTITRRSISENIFLSCKFVLKGKAHSKAKYTYIAALIRASAYHVDFKLSCGGNKSTTSLKANNAVLVKGFKIGGVGLKKINSETVYNWIKGMFPSSSVSIEKGRKVGGVYFFSLPLSGLLNGKYYLLIAAWNSSNISQKVVAFSQEIISLKTRHPAPIPVFGGGGGGGGVVVMPTITPTPTPKPTSKPTPTPTPTATPSIPSIPTHVNVSKNATTKPTANVTPPVSVTTPSKPKPLVPMYIVLVVTLVIAITAMLAYILRR